MNVPDCPHTNGNLADVIFRRKHDDRDVGELGIGELLFAKSETVLFVTRQRQQNDRRAHAVA